MNTETDLNELIETIIEDAGLRRPRNAFFQTAKDNVKVTPEAALSVGVQWQAVTKAFMFTTLASVGVKALECHREANPDREMLGALQTAFSVIGDDFVNTAPEFSSLAPVGPAGIHYLWWADTIVQPLVDQLGSTVAAEAAVLPEGVRGLLENMERLAQSPLGAAVQLRLVEDIALDIAVAFRRMYSKVQLDSVALFSGDGALDWVDSHIRAETVHAKSVSDDDTGMTTLATTAQERADLVRLLAEYAGNWARTLNGFAAALDRPYALAH